MPRILSVAYDASLLNSRSLMLESCGYEVVSALGFAEAIKQCNSGGNFALLILGHSIPHEDKEAMIAAFRVLCSGPVLALRHPDEEVVRGADFVIDPDPAQLLTAVSTLVESRLDAGVVD